MRTISTSLTVAALALVAAPLAPACATGGDQLLGFEPTDAATTDAPAADSPTGSFGDAGGMTSAFQGDPTDCTQAAQAKSYMGCDFWPTMLPNTCVVHLRLCRRRFERRNPGCVGARHGSEQLRSDLECLSRDVAEDLSPLGARSQR